MAEELVCAALTEFAGCALPPSFLFAFTDDDATDVTVAPFGVSFPSVPSSLPPSFRPPSLSSVLSRRSSLLASSPNEHRFPVMALQRERGGGGETVNTLTTYSDRP